MKTKSNKSVNRDNELDAELRVVAKEFIDKFGMFVFLDVCQGTVNKILVTMGIISSKDLRDAYLLDLRKATSAGTAAKAIKKKAAKGKL